MRIESIKRKIDNKSIISFDVFGTLIDRVVKSPSQIFNLVEKRAFLDGYKVEEFAKNRILAEQIARNSSKKDEVTLDEIYDHLPYNIEIKEYLKKTEINIEKEAVTSNHIGRILIQYAQQHGKEIIIISDMYLSSKTISELLDKCGYGEFRYKLFVSSEYGICKRRAGKLYTHVIEEQGYDRDKILHIGDDIKADYTMAKMANIDAVLVHNRVEDKELNSKSYLIKRILQCGHQSTDYFYNFGYYNYGPLVFGFCKWISNLVQKGKYDELIFIARDGYVLQKAYEIVSPITSQQVFKSYFFASRRSSVVSTLLDNPSIENVFRKGMFRATADINDFLERYGISQDDVKEEMATYHITGKESIDLLSIRNSNNVQRFVVSVLQKQKSYFKEQDRLFQEYICQEVRGRKNLVVDTGYNGTIQHVVQSKKNDCVFKGAYIGVNSEERGKYKDVDAIGYLMDGNSDEKTQLSVRTMMGMYDLFFSAPYGSTIGYERTEDGTIKPILGEYEYQDYPDEAKKIQQLRAGAIDAVKVLSESPIISLIRIDGKTASSFLFKKCISPDDEDLEKLGDLLFLNGKMLPLAKPDEAKTYFTHPSKLKIDFGESMWKVGFMKRLFKAPLPYNKTLELLLKINDLKNKKNS